MDFTLKEKAVPVMRKESWISERIWNHIITDTELPKSTDQKEEKGKTYIQVRDMVIEENKTMLKSNGFYNFFYYIPNITYVYWFGYSKYIFYVIKYGS